MLDFEQLELSQSELEDNEQALLETVIGLDSFLFDPLFEEEVELLKSTGQL